MKAKFEKLKIELLPSEIADKFLFIKNKTDNFTKSKLVEMSKDNFNSLYDIVEKKFPEAIEGYKAPEPEVKKKKVIVEKEIKEKIKKEPAKKSEKKKDIKSKHEISKMSDDQIRKLLKERKEELNLPKNWSIRVKKREALISLYLQETTFDDYVSKRDKLADVKYTHIENSDDETLKKAKKLLDAEEMKVDKKDKPKLKRKPRTDSKLNKDNIGSIIKRKTKDLPEEKKAKVKETELIDIIDSALNKYFSNL